MNTHDPADFPSPELLDRYLAGDVAPEERAALDAWAAHPENALVLEATRTAWALDETRHSSSATQWNVDARWERMRSQLGGPARQTLSPGATRRANVHALARRRTAWPWIGSAVAACAVAVFLWVGTNGPQTQHGDGAGSTIHVATTRPAERATFRLPDGSTVTAAPGTRVRVAPGFSSSNRDVYLDGEAVFQVVSLPGQPFVVHTNGVATQVLGTRFGVRRYADDGEDMRIAVAEGRVSVAGTVLAPGDVARLTPSRAPVVTRNADVEAMLSWTHGRLVFERAPLSEVAHEIRRWYDVSVTIEGADLARLPVNLTLDAAYPLETVADIIRVTTGSTVRILGDSILVAPQEPRS